jgi:hypothetical protein
VLGLLFRPCIRPLPFRIPVNSPPGDEGSGEMKKNIPTKAFSPDFSLAGKSIVVSWKVTKKQQFTHGFKRIYIDSTAYKNRILTQYIYKIFSFCQDEYENENLFFYKRIAAAHKGTGFAEGKFFRKEFIELKDGVQKMTIFC